MNPSLDVLDLFAGTLSGEALILHGLWRVSQTLAEEASPDALMLSSHVRDAAGNLLVEDGARSGSVPPAPGEYKILLPLFVPVQPQLYLVELDPVVEQRFWGSALGFSPEILRVERLANADLLVEQVSAGRKFRVGFNAPAPGPDQRSWFFDLAKLFTPVLAVETPTGRFFVNTADTIISRSMFIGGTFGDSDELGAVMEVLTSLGKSGATERKFVDVGANIGTTSIEAVKRFGFRGAIAFEPQDENYRFLELNVRVNSLEDLVETLQLALSDGVKEVVLELSGNNWGDHRIRIGDTVNPEQLDLFGEEGRKTVPVQAVTFDHLISSQRIHLKDLGLVWMDTQGHEAHVLAGAQSLLQSDLPLVIEFWPYGLKRAHSLKLLLDILDRHYSQFVDIGAAVSTAKRGEILPASELGALESTYSVPGHTVLLLLKD